MLPEGNGGSGGALTTRPHYALPRPPYLLPPPPSSTTTLSPQRPSLEVTLFSARGKLHFFFCCQAGPKSFSFFCSFPPFLSETVFSSPPTPSAQPSLSSPPHPPHRTCLCLNIFTHRLNSSHRFLPGKRLRGSSLKGGLEIDHLNIWLRGHRDRARAAQDIQARRAKHGRKGEVARRL